MANYISGSKKYIYPQYRWKSDFVIELRYNQFYDLILECPKNISSARKSVSQCVEHIMGWLWQFTEWISSVQYAAVSTRVQYFEIAK